MSMVSEAMAANEADFLERLLEKAKKTNPIIHDFLTCEVWNRYDECCREAFRDPKPELRYNG